MLCCVVLYAILLCQRRYFALSFQQFPRPFPFEISSDVFDGS